MRRFECSAVLFDLDGVLVDSAAFIELQWRRWATRRGLDAEPFIRVCHGRRAVETIRLAAPHLDAEAEVAAYDPANEPGLDRLRPVPGAASLLGRLPAGTWAVATSGPRMSAEARLRSVGLPVPRVLVCAEDVTRGKPSPDVYLRAAEGLEVEPAQCVVIEDAPPGLEAAHRAGMRTVALATTHSAADLQADAVAPDLTRVHLSRAERTPDGAWTLELLVAS